MIWWHVVENVSILLSVVSSIVMIVQALLYYKWKRDYENRLNQIDSFKTESFHDYVINFSGHPMEYSQNNWLHVSAIDGTTIALENMPELVDYFGCSGAGATAATASASVLYDVLNEVLLDARITKLSCGERELASQLSLSLIS